MRKLSMTLLIFLSALILSSCAQVPNIPICYELDVDRAHCAYTLDQSMNFEWNETNLYLGKTYWEAKPTLLQLPPSSWAEIKAFIVKICKKQGNCPEIEKIFLKIERK